MKNPQFNTSRCLLLPEPGVPGYNSHYGNQNYDKLLVFEVSAAVEQMLYEIAS